MCEGKSVTESVRKVGLGWGRRARKEWWDSMSSGRSCQGSRGEEADRSPHSVSLGVTWVSLAAPLREPESVGFGEHMRPLSSKTSRDDRQGWALEANQIKGQKKKVVNFVQGWELGCFRTVFKAVRGQMMVREATALQRVFTTQAWGRGHPQAPAAQRGNVRSEHLSGCPEMISVAPL